MLRPEHHDSANPMRTTRLILPAAILVLAHSPGLHAAITFVSGTPGANDINIADPYTQDFNTLASSGTGAGWTNDSTLAGWHADKTTYSATGGGATGTGAMYSYGSGPTTGDPASVLTDRSLGGQPNTTTSIILGLQLINDSGATINLVDVGFFIEQWRADTTPNSPVTFSYQVFAAGTGSLTGGTYSTVPELTTTPSLTTGIRADGTTAAGAIMGNLHVTELDATLNSLDWTNGSELWLRWTFSKTAGSNIHAGLDSLTVSVIPEPSAALLAALATLALLRRRRA